MILHHRHTARIRRAPVLIFVEAALAGDLERSTIHALDFMDSTGSRVSVITDLFDVAQLHIEDRWHVGDATADGEYRVFEAIQLAMAALPAPNLLRRRDQTASAALLMTAPAEEHELGLRLVAAALEDDGWDVDFVPRLGPADLEQRVGPGGVNLIGISSTYEA